MARYYPISPLLWTDPKVRAWNDGTFRLALYLLTCRHRNLEGLYWLPPAYAAADLDWPLEKVSESMHRLIEDGFIEYDAEAEVVFVCKALKYQRPKSPNQIKGAIAVLEEIPPHGLASSLVAAAERYAPEFHGALVNGSLPDES